MGKTIPDDVVTGFEGDTCQAWGLTKREDFAARVMSGLLGSYRCNVTEAEIKSAARTAVRAARILIDELNAEEE
jgi:hypothetical protein